MSIVCPGRSLLPLQLVCTMAYSKHLRATQEHMRIITLALARLIKLCGTEECSWIENSPYPVSYSAIHSPGSTPRHNLLAPAGTWWPVLQLPWTRNPLFTQQPHPGLAHWVMLRRLCIVFIQERWRGGKGLGFLRRCGGYFLQAQEVRGTWSSEFSCASTQKAPF